MLTKCCTNSKEGLRGKIYQFYEDALEVANFGIAPINFDQENVNLEMAIIRKLRGRNKMKSETE